MKLCFAKGRLSNNQHGPNSEVIRGWTVHVCKLETFRRLSTGAEAIQSLVGRRLWIYAPSGACWNFDVYLLPMIKECEPWPAESEKETKP